MNRQAAVGLILFLGLLLVAVVVYWLMPEGEESAPSEAGESPNGDAPAMAAEKTMTVDLFFPGQGGRLYSEPRQVAFTEDAVQQVRYIVQEVLAGPRSPELRASLPTGTVLGGVHLEADGVAYIDLESPERIPPPPTGSSRELLMVYSLVDSVGLNVSAVERICVLWNGEQRVTFAGHVDTTQPLAPDTSLLAKPP